ncbi:MAG: dockerin type I repeat-containing protein [Clostridia bacterium]|nr:dockerin type I repeat-containing protein [Clostridia bacterium]
MKKHSISIILALVICFSSLFVSAQAALAMGDIDGNGKIQANDARLALRYSVELESLDHQQLKAADVNYNGKIKADDARIILRVSVGLDEMQIKDYTFNGHKTNSDCISIETGIVCIDPDCCGETLVPSFNELVNVLKSSGSRNYFSGFTKSTTVTQKAKATEKNFIYWGLAQMLQGMLNSDITEGTEVEYSYFTNNRHINKNTFPVNGEDYISDLKESDVESISITKMSGIDFIKELPSSYNVTTSGVTVDLSSIKNANIGDVYKVSIAIIPERASVKNLPEDNSAIERIFNSKYNDEISQSINSLDDMFAEFPELSNFMAMDAKITTTCTVDYYFTTDTFEPVCASYNIGTDTNSETNLYVNNDGEKQKDPTVSISIKALSSQQNYYFFNNHFTDK